jgi:AraC-like DNA-binding protein
LNAFDLYAIIKVERMCQPQFAPTPTGFLHHARSERLTRHTHREGFAAIVLRGEYLEAGDRGRVNVVPGDVILHGPYESHQDHVAASGADVLIVPWLKEWFESPLGSVSDPDKLARLSERDMREAAHMLAEEVSIKELPFMDWPDMLARDLWDRPEIELKKWADTMGIRPETVSRGFRRAFGVSPQSFRARARLLRALSGIRRGEKLAELAAECGFADQAHLSRHFRVVTGETPHVWRRQAVPV